MCANTHIYIYIHLSIESLYTHTNTYLPLPYILSLIILVGNGMCPGTGDLAQLASVCLVFSGLCVQSPVLTAAVWCTLVMLSPKRRRWEGQRFKVTLGNIPSFRQA